MNHRPDRVASLIQEELGALLVRELEFPGALVTVSGVEVTKKLDLARVEVSVLPHEREAEVMKTLAAAQGELQFKLGRKLNIKPMPTLKFEIDHGVENAAAVEKRLLEDEGK
ncbi:MAG: 30S ribosome-binding factor RbfA [Candidatus Liptonbacteria bacterium]|nr:30S ribosome-binding factor RbfA [Candidatus Liptonbacteria bacterium]